MPADFRDADPRELRLPSSRRTGADWVKLQRQIARFGASMIGMPPIWVREGADGELLIQDGVTRATRIAKLYPRDIGSRRSCFKVRQFVRSLPKSRGFPAMINATRREALEKLAVLSELAPEMRLGQLIANLAVMAEGPWDETLWDLEDEKLVSAARQLAADLARRNESVA